MVIWDRLINDVHQLLIKEKIDMMNGRKEIPTYNLRERNQDGLDIRQLDQLADHKEYLDVVHRDDHYLLIYQENGRSNLMVDFNEVSFEGQCIFIVLPGQVHYGLSAKDASVFLMALDSSWVNEDFQAAFSTGAYKLQPMSLSPAQSSLFKGMILMMNELHRNMEEIHFYHLSIRSLTDSYLRLFASVYHRERGLISDSQPRIVEISRQFAGLVKNRFKDMKRPSDYADALNISTAYLNEAVKKVTGETVSFRIREAVIVEAKRLLFYTRLTVKEISIQLGYEDYTYFSRLFVKSAGISPKQFRTRYSR